MGIVLAIDFIEFDNQNIIGNPTKILTKKYVYIAELQSKNNY